MRWRRSGDGRDEELRGGEGEGVMEKSIEV